MEVEETKESSDFECGIESVPSCANLAAELAKWVVSSSQFWTLFLIISYEDQVVA